ncbi:hypothetical protein C2S51_026779 [Perilla frutescens var. frutescens]|nr:hypothetical protein C2S51_026779 [Perilla frutescens var. frutescens]
MECSRISLLLFFLICAFPRRSEESFHELLRELAQRGDHEMSPSPSPLPATSPATQPTKLTCDNVPNTCRIENCSVTACVPSVGNGSEDSYLVVVNGGESSLHLNIVVRPANKALDGLLLSGHQVKKVNLPSNMSEDSSILLKVGNGECTIHFGALIPQGFFYSSYMTSINATYLLFAVALFMGGSWACCKLVKKRRQHHDGGTPYEELQMEQQVSDSTFVVGKHEGWDQSWDGEWDDDEEKGARKVSENIGGSLKYVDTAQWGNDWDD